MQIRAVGLLIFAMVLLVGCDQQSDLGEPLTVCQYVHDVDLARAIMNKGNTNPAKYANDLAFINAAKAVFVSAEIGTGYEIVDGKLKPYTCWADSMMSTTSADHACLDKRLRAFGYESLSTDSSADPLGGVVASLYPPAATEGDYQGCEIPGYAAGNNVSHLRALTEKNEIG